MDLPHSQKYEILKMFPWKVGQFCYFFDWGVKESVKIDKVT